MAAYFDLQVTLHHPLEMTRKACQDESICCTATRSINFLGGGWSVWCAACWVPAPKGAVSAEISSAGLAICHYLMVNPSVSGIRGSHRAKPPGDRAVRKRSGRIDRQKGFFFYMMQSTKRFSSYFFFSILRKSLVDDAGKIKHISRLWSRHSERTQLCGTKNAFL